MGLWGPQHLGEELRRKQQPQHQHENKQEKENRHIRRGPGEGEDLDVRSYKKMGRMHVAVLAM